MSQKNDLLDLLYRIKDSIIAIDSNYNITYANEAYANIFGFQSSNIIGKNVWKLLPNTVDSIVYRKVLEAFQKKEALRFEWQGIYTDKLWETTIFPSDKGVTAITRDITERKKAEEAVYCSNQRLELILTIANQLLSNTNPQTLIEGICQKVMAFLNCAVFFNYLVDEKDNQRLHLNAYSGVTPEIAQNLEWLRLGQLACGCAIKEGRRIIWANMLESDDERIALLRSYGIKAYVANPFFSREKVIGCLSFGSKNKDAFSADELSFMATVATQVGIAMDRKRTEDAFVRAKDELTVILEKAVEEKTAQLRESERLAAIGATAGMVGHDIRNPLQAIMSDAYLLKDELSSLPECRTKEGIAESIDSIDKNIGYINKIVADLQDYARPLNPENIDVNLAYLVDSVVKPIFMPDNIILTINVADDIRLKTDPIFIRRSITNLVTNAIQAMPNGGELTINVSKNADMVLISVVDTGVGIPDDVKPKLFTPMVTTKAKGQGLGLAVVKRLVEALNGNVTFESQEGKGTKFTITLPSQP